MSYSLMMSAQENTASTPVLSFSKAKFQPFSEHSTDSAADDSISRRTRSKIKPPTAKPAGEVKPARAKEENSFLEQSIASESDSEQKIESGI